MSWPGSGLTGVNKSPDGLDSWLAHVAEESSSVQTLSPPLSSDTSFSSTVGGGGALLQSPSDVSAAEIDTSAEAGTDRALMHDKRATATLFIVVREG